MRPVHPSMVMARFALAVLLVLTWVSYVAHSATNLVSTSIAGENQVLSNVSQFVPAACAGMPLVEIAVVPGDKISKNSLILISTPNNNVKGSGGDDCIVSGSGSYDLSGGGGDDVIVGGPGNDNITGSGGKNDRCYGGGGTNTYDRCEYCYISVSSGEYAGALIATPQCDFTYFVSP